MRREGSIEKIRSPAVVGSSCDGGSWETHEALGSVPALPIGYSSCGVDHVNCIVVR